jgi:hypothetical protein
MAPLPTVFVFSIFCFIKIPLNTDHFPFTSSYVSNLNCISCHLLAFDSFAAIAHTYNVGLLHASFSTCSQSTVHDSDYVTHNFYIFSHTPILCISPFYKFISPTPYISPTSLIQFRPSYTRKSFFTFLLLLLAGDIHLNPGPCGSEPYIPFQTKPYLSIMLACQNIRSVSNKSAIISELVSSNKLDILCLTETWLNSINSTPSFLSSFTPSNFVLSHFDRPNSKRGGGVAILLRNSLKSVPFSLPNFSTFECIGSSIYTSSSSFRLIVLYRPPSSPLASFFEEFESLLELYAASSTDIVITGDFNIHVNTSNHHSNRLSEILHTFNLKQLISFPTHSSGHTLDLLITHSSSNLVSFAFPQDNCISDHLSVIAQLDIPKSKTSKTTFTYRPLKSIDTDLFSNDIKSAFSNYASLDINSLVTLYNSTLSSLLDKHAPERTITCSPRSSNPWFSSTLLIEKRRKRRLERLWRKTGKTSDRLAFRKQCHAFNHLLQKSQSDYYKSLVSNSTDPKSLWNAIGKILHRSTSLPMPSLPQLAERFSQFFSSKISRLRSALPLSNIDPFSIPNVPPTSFCQFSPITIDETRKLILASPPTNSPGDPIPTSLLISCIDAICPIITDIVNLSLKSGSFPSACKIASVTPLLKKTNLEPDDLKNYRPISNLSFLSKVIERVVSAQLTSHLTTNNLFNSNQSAYRKFHSTETALLSVQNDLLISMDNGLSSALLLLDLSAAFDTVDHSILLHRLENWFGISQTALLWFKSFLSDRSQSVHTSHSTSTLATLLFGVPQGSVLGPLLFSLYTKPLSSLISQYPDIRHHLYADDTQIYLSFSPSTSSSAIALIESCLQHIFSWMSANKLALNPDKTEYLLISPNTSTSAPSMNLGPTTIIPTDNAKNLGVIFQSDLSLTNHISAVVKSCFFHIRDLKRIRSCLSRNTATSIANAFVQSRLDYCNSLYFGLPKRSIYRLQKVQNCLARVVFRSSRHSHITPVLKSLHWLPVHFRIKFKICLITHRLLSFNQPPYLSHALTYRSNSHSVRSSSFNPFLVPSFRKQSAGYRSFSYAAPHLWNHLPVSVRSAASYMSFRRNLKTHLFNQAFPT